MRDHYSNWFQHFCLVCLALTFINTSLSAQLIVERELIGAVVAVSSPTPDVGTQQLQVDASFGESMIGYQDGDIIITVGFHQTNTAEEQGEFGDFVEGGEVVSEKVSVNAYPNPTVERMTVDLGDYREKFTQLRIIDIYGRTVKLRKIAGEQMVTFRELDKLPNANYFLQGIDVDGKFHQLATVLIITY